jgi:tetratricopeptide (TPR) repeat protein
MGLVLFGLGRIDEALPRFEQALALRPDDPAYLEMAGRCYINKADFPKAVEYLEKAKAGTTDPDRIKFLEDLIATLKAQIKK